MLSNSLKRKRADSAGGGDDAIPAFRSGTGRQAMATSGEQELMLPSAKTRRRRAADYLGLERNVVIVSTAVFLLGTGEELWKKFLPKYLEHLGAGPVVVGLFGTTEDFFDAVYQYPGGWLADRA